MIISFHLSAVLLIMLVLYALRKKIEVTFSIRWKWRFDISYLSSGRGRWFARWENFSDIIYILGPFKLSLFKQNEKD